MFFAWLYIKMPNVPELGTHLFRSRRAAVASRSGEDNVLTKGEGTAKKLLDTEWKAIKYLVENYSDKMFVGMGIPYNEALISLDEICQTELGRIGP